MEITNTSFCIQLAALCNAFHTIRIQRADHKQREMFDRIPNYMIEANLKIYENLARIQVEQKTDFSNKIFVVQYMNTEVKNDQFYYDENTKSQRMNR